MDTTGALTRRKTITATTLIALFAALTAAGTFISIPLPFSPVPIVLQNMFALLSGLILGPVFGGAAIALYLVAGAIGAPVFAGAAGGVVHLAGPTGGFLFGYLCCAVLSGLIIGTPRAEKKTALWRLIAASAAGLLVVYVPGLIRLNFVYNDWAKTLVSGFIPYIIGDAIKGAAAVLAASRLRKVAADLMHN